MFRNILAILLLLPFLAFTQNDKLIVHYPLQGNIDATIPTVGEVETINAKFRSEGLYLAGNYGSYDENDTKGTLLKFYTPEFSPDEFGIEVSFKTVEPVTIGAGMTVFSVGHSCRYFGLYITQENKIGLKLSNGDVRASADVAIETGKWYTFFCSYSLADQKARLYQNGKLILEMSHKIDFSICGKTKDVSTTDFGNGNAFKGYLKDWKFFTTNYFEDIKPKEEDVVVIDDGNQDGNNGGNSDKDNEKPKNEDIVVSDNIKQEYFDINLPVEPFQYTQIAPRPDGHSYLAWNEAVKKELHTFGKLHITTLDKNLKPVGQDILLPDYEIRQLVAIDNNSIYLVVGERKDNKFTEWYIYDHLEANIIHFLKIDLKGNILFKTTLFGDKGQGPNAIWADNGFGTRYETKLAFNGTHFGLYTGIRRNFAKNTGENDVHEGDIFMLLDQSGKVLEDKTQKWYSSHAFYQKLVVNSQSEFITANVGDAYPVGVLVRNRQQNSMNNVWPPEKVTYQSGKTWYFAAGRLGEMLTKDGNIYLLHASSRKGESQQKDPLDILFLKLNSSLEIQKTEWLTNSANNNERYVYAGWLGNQILLAYAANDNYRHSYSRMQLLGLDGKTITQLIDLKIEFDYTTSHFVPYPDGSLVITKTDRSGKKVSILKVSR